MSTRPRRLTAGHPTAVMWHRLLASTPVSRALTDPVAARLQALAWPLPVRLPADLPHGPLLYLTLDAQGGFRYVGRTIQPLAKRMTQHRHDRPDIASHWHWALVADVTVDAAAAAEEWIRATLQPPDNRIRASGWSRSTADLNRPSWPA